MSEVAKKFSHYYRPTPFEGVDVYRILHLFNVTDPCLQHAIKKLLVAGGRGAKDIEKDVSEATATLIRWQEMRTEEATHSTVAAATASDQCEIYLEPDVRCPQRGSFLRNGKLMCSEHDQRFTRGNTSQLLHELAVKKGQEGGA